jgi:Domain of unknown function (DUF6946)
MDVYYGSPRSVDFATLLYQYPDREFRKLTRSTVPLLDYWGRDPEAALARVCGLLQINPVPDAKLCFEYPVASVPPAKSSFTDIMCIAPNLAIGVEGKSTEGLDRTVGEWLQRRKGVTGFREKVRDHWVDLINSTRAADVDRERLPGVVYQMLHRTASVCAVQPGKRVRRRVVLYQLFLVESKLSTKKMLKKESDLRQALQAWVDVLRPTDGLQLWIHVLRLKATPHLECVQKDFDAAKAKDRPDLLRRALFDSALYDVAGETAERVTPAAP